MKLCLDIGGYSIESAIVKDNKINRIYKTLTQANKGRKTVLNNICRAIDKFNKKDISSINIGMPGPADYKKGILKNTPNLPLKNFNLKKYLYKKYKKKYVKFENDAKCFALGEAVFGAGKEYKNILGITLGTGIGGGIVINKKLYQGRGNAGEIGYYFIKNNQNIEIVFQKLKDRKGHIRNYNILGYYLGIAITNYIHILDPDIIIIGGGISKHFNKFKKEMNKTIKEKIMFKPCKVVKAKLKNAALLGVGLI